MSCWTLPWRFGALNAYRALLQHVDVAGKRLLCGFRLMPRIVEHIRVAIPLRSMSRVSVLHVLRVT